MKLKWCADILNGYAFKSEVFGEEGIPIVRQSNLKSGRIVHDGKCYPSELVPSKFLLKDNDICIGLSGSVENFGFIDESVLPCALNQRVGALRAIRRKALPRYVGYFVQSNLFKLHIASNLPSTTIVNIDASLVGNAFFPDLDLATQRQIADFLDRETARIDLLIEKKQQLVKLLGERLTSLITKFAKQGLTGETLIGTGFDWWSHAPASWQVHRIASLFQESKEMGEKGLPVLSVSINWGISDRELADEDRDRIVNHIEDKTSYKRVRVGDLVYNMMRAWQGAFGVAKVDGLVSPAYVVARPQKGLHPIYFEHLLRTPSCVEEFRRASKGIADFRQRLYWEHFRQVRLVIPPYEEQVSIAERIVNEQARFAPIIVKTQESIDRLKEYRSALITSAVTGQIDVQTYGKSGAIDRRLDAIQAEMGA